MAEHSCDHSWCIAARTGAMCDCPFAQMFPHRVRDCTRRGTVSVIGRSAVKWGPAMVVVAP